MSRDRLTLLGLAMLVPALGLAEAPATPPRPEGAHPATEGASHAKGAAGKKGKAAAETKAAETPLPSQAVDPADARAAIAAATAYLDAVKSGGFAAAPPLLHPQALASFKDRVLPRLEQDRAHGTRTLLNATFGRDAGVESAQAADPADFMARFVRVVIARDPQAAPRFATLTPLGVVGEGDRVHVLVRLGGIGASEGEGRLEVVSLERDGKTWKVLLDRRLEEMAEALGGPGRGAERRAPMPRIEPMPEGVGPTPLVPGPQGPAGLPPLLEPQGAGGRAAPR